MGRWLLVVALLAAAATAAASEKAKEQRWAEQIVGQLIEGEAVWLEAAGDRFLAIHTAPSGAPRGGIVIAHGLGVHPDWQQVIYPLRVGLAERGWATLSIQMPILLNDVPIATYVPLFDEVGPRLDAAIAWLQARYRAPLALVAHSLGATMSTYHLSNSPQIPLGGFVAIGLGGNAKYPVMDVEQRLDRIRLPMLDLYGDRDLQAVLDGVGPRAAAASGNPRYRQLKIDNAGHFFDGRDAVLVESVDAWLKENLPPTGR